MKIKTGFTTTTLDARKAEPVIEVDASEIGERHSLGVCHIDFKNEAGNVGSGSMFGWCVAVRS